MAIFHHVIRILLDSNSSHEGVAFEPRKPTGSP
jgi:hypothetical protein